MLSPIGIGGFNAGVFETTLPSTLAGSDVAVSFIRQLSDMFGNLGSDIVTFGLTGLLVKHSLRVLETL